MLPQSARGATSGGGREIWNLSLSPNGDRVAVLGEKEDIALYLVDARDRGVVRPPLDLRWPTEPTWSPSGDWLAFAGQAGEDEPVGVYILQPDGTGLRRLSDGGPPMAWSPDGQRIAFAR